ncbi:unnamed protein product [Laminaria digitata]
MAFSFFWRPFLAAFLIVLPPSAEASPSATMRFMEHLHSSAPAPDGGEAQLFVSKRAWVEDRACTRLSRTPHLSLSQPWFPSAVELAEGFWSAEVAALAC